MRPPLFCVLLACAVIPASAGIHPISFRHSLSAETFGSYSYIDASSGSFGNDTAGTGPVTFLSEVLPPLPYSVLKNGSIPPGRMAPTWTGGVLPSVAHGFSPTKWLASTALDGTVSALDANLSLVLTLKGSLKPSAGSVMFEFSTDSPMDLSISGWSFLDPVTKVPIATPTNGGGQLPGGTYLVGLTLTPDSEHMSFNTSTTLMIGHPLTDSDGDGLSDEEETNVRNTDPQKADSDDDGLSDYAEIRIHQTPPNDPDADDDGFADSAEIGLGLSPVNASSVPAAGVSVRQMIEVRALTKIGKSYRLQYSNNLFDWTDSPTVIQGNGKDVRYGLEYIESSAKYWRLQEVP